VGDGSVSEEPTSRDLATIIGLDPLCRKKHPQIQWE
jgi:hypothetical protein